MKIGLRFLKRCLLLLSPLVAFWPEVGTAASAQPKRETQAGQAKKPAAKATAKKSAKRSAKKPARHAKKAKPAPLAKVKPSPPKPVKAEPIKAAAKAASPTVAAERPPPLQVDASTVEKKIAPPQPAPAPAPRSADAAVKSVAPAAAAKVDITALLFSGNQAVSDPELQEALKSFVGTSIAKSDLRNLTAKVGQVYRDRGYLAHAYVRPESLVGGHVEVIVVESKLGEVRISEGSDSRLEPAAAVGYVTAQQQPGEVVEPKKVAKGVRILNEVPGVAATSTLTAGGKPEHTDVLLNLKDKPAVSGSVRGDNRGAKTTGRARAIGNVSVNNPSGQGDQVTAMALASDHSSYARLGYEAPLGRSGLRAGAYVGRMSYRIQGALANLDNSGNATGWGAYTSYPVMRDGVTDLTFTGAYDKRNLLDSALNVRTMNRGTTTVSGGLAGSHRSDLGLTSFAAAATGGTLDMPRDSAEFAADQAGPRAAGGFAKLNWNLGQQLPIDNTTEVAALASGQVASKNLDSGDKFYLGGPTAVRAYSVSDGQGDEGWLTKLELRRNLGPDFRVLAFADMGRTKVNKRPWDGWNAANPLQPNAYMLFGTGLGFDWRAPYGIEVQATVALPVGNNPGKAPGSSEENNFFGRSNAWISAQKVF